ncbi:hypothetical protein [Neorhizobium galegae]|uniref:hypothetical protein n=1 Tax=Neorhizobium galegae TaxID=399 RepID=UPI002105068D|nr:hypothetical protein [Neorhizobium galegae]MCQ1850388.1 hypothetical protein [Neorhizobium galegae]
MEILSEIADGQRRVHEMQHKISLLPSSLSMPPDYTRMIEWANSELANLEQRVNMAGIQERLQKEGLFPDPESDPLFEDAAMNDYPQPDGSA